MIRTISIYLFTILFALTLLAGCDNQKKISLPGYIEGKYTYISPNYGGTLKEIYVTAGENVKVGQKLFLLDTFSEHQDVKIASARVNEAINQKAKAEDNYNLQKIKLNRKAHLEKQEVISKEELDAQMNLFRQAALQLKAEENNVNALQASASKAEWQSKQKIVSSPIAARVFDTYYNQGEWVPSETPIVSLLAPAQIKIIFFVPEPLLSKIRLNQSIEVLRDGYSNTIEAKITYISNQAQYTPPIIYSTDEREKLVYRVEALPRNPNVNLELHPGQPITVKM